LPGTTLESPPARGLLRRILATVSAESGACRTEKENATVPRVTASFVVGVLNPGLVVLIEAV